MLLLGQYIKAAEQLLAEDRKTLVTGILFNSFSRRSFDFRDKFKVLKAHQEALEPSDL